MSAKLIDERPILLLPSLALNLGLSNAIFLQQLNYWCNVANDFGYGVNHGGYLWVYKTAEEWQEKDFPFWSVRTIRRIIADLEEKGIIATAMLHDNKWNKTNYYRIDKLKLSELLKIGSNPQSADVDKMSLSSGQNVTIDDDNLAQSKLPDCPHVTENTTENTSDIHTNNSVNDVFNLWTPDMNILNSRLNIAGEKPMTWEQVLPVLIDVNSHYENMILNGSATPNKMYSNFVKWVKGDYAKHRKTSRSASAPVNNKNVNQAWGQEQYYAPVSETENEGDLL